MCYYNCQIPEILLPLMALIDYRGFRVVAISMLPVGKDTIIYGSHNAGKDVHAEDKTFNALMKVVSSLPPPLFWSGGLQPASYCWSWSHFNLGRKFFESEGTFSWYNKTSSTLWTC